MRRLVVIFQKLEDDSLIAISYQIPITLEDLKIVMESLANGELAVNEVREIETTE
jgi:hypothetical protein